AGGGRVSWGGAESGKGGGGEEGPDHSPPQQEPAGGIPSQRAPAAIRRGSREQCQIAQPPSSERDDWHGDKEDAGKRHDYRRRRRRRNQPSHVTPAERSDQDRQWREIKQEDRSDRSRHHGGEQQRRCRPGSQSDQYDLHHLQLSRFISG